MKKKEQFQKLVSNDFIHSYNHSFMNGFDKAYVMWELIQANRRKSLVLIYFTWD